MADTKVITKERLECPHCKKRVLMTIWKETIKKTVAGEYKIRSRLEKDTQRTLEKARW